MGLIKCETHGDQGIVHLCSHLYDSYSREKLYGINYQVKKDKLGTIICLCERCLNNYNLDCVEVLDFDDLVKIGDDLWPVCGKCLAQTEGSSK